jgi:2-methylcitrate dehydratase PrpD
VPAASTLAEFGASLRWSELPLSVRERAKELVLDLLGVAACGSAEVSSQAVARFVATLQPSGTVTVIGGGRTSSAAWAALANGTAAHAIELDDVTTESSLHPGVTVIPVALAVAEERGAPATDFLEAVVTGYEVTVRVGNALNPASAYQRGFHPTSVAGVFGAAFAAGRLQGLATDGLTRALGIAGTLAAGSLEYLSDGSFTKRLNAGWAAHAGIVAAGLARAGFTGPPTALEGRLGVLHAYSDDPQPERLLASLGEPLQIMRVSIKPYACCRYNHGLIDCMLQLRRERAIRPEDVASIRLGVLSGGALLVAEPSERKRAPANVVDAQFSAPFAAAVALVHGAAGREQHSLANVADPLIRSLMARTECYRDASLDAAYPTRWPAAAEIRLKDGRTFATRIEYATGEPENPVPRDGLIEKFVSLSENLVPAEPAHVLADRILRLEEEPSLRGVLRELRG